MQVCCRVANGGEDRSLASCSGDVEDMVGPFATEFEVVIVDIPRDWIVASVCSARWAFEERVENTLSGNADWFECFRIEHLHR